ncbi:MAG: hypothetical protein H8E31_01270 [Planctomycetes bacterium]|nr:hypothetical protein [Planctomycetota bacterium]
MSGGIGVHGRIGRCQVELAALDFGEVDEQLDRDATATYDELFEALEELGVGDSGDS